MQTSRFRVGPRSLVVVSALLVGSAAARRAGARPSPEAAAEALFREGKESLAAKDYARACIKLAQSLHLDPATGTLLALAICHEREGKLASAWAEYAEAAARSKREARSDREKAARQRVAALEPRLSRLTIGASPVAMETRGLVVTRNGVPVWTLGAAVPVDGGTYLIEATAPGKKPWRAPVTVGKSGDRRTMIIPALEDDPAPPPEAGRARAGTVRG